MKDREEIIELFNIYGKLLTNNQQDIFESYYYEDLSLKEISENLGISKSYVGKSLQNINKKILEFEKTLKIQEKNKKILSVVDKKTKKIIENIING